MKDDRKGWRITIPGGKPLATPAWADGKIFLGGGFGSHEFYCLDADDGKILWTFRTGDDGPTAAVVDDGYVAFNTESCTIYVLEIASGKQAWSKWLGDPLLSQPAIAAGKIYMAYPGKDGSHHLVCMALRDGKQIWDEKIAGDIIAAPVVHGGSVYLTTFDGTVYRYGSQDGKLAWSDKRGATSPPWIWKDQVLISHGRDVAGRHGGMSKNELLGWRSTGPSRGGGTVLESSEQQANYLDARINRGTGGIAFNAEATKSSVALDGAQKAADSGVGFGAVGGAPPAAKLEAAGSNTGVSNVSGAWAYQGSRPSVAADLSFAAMGDLLLCHDLKSGRVLWRKSLKPERAADGLRFLSPPALANGKLFLSSAFGDVLCMAGTGELRWSVNVGVPVVFQPSIAKGRVFIATTGGHVVAIDTGDPKDDGWPMWGGGPAHNGPK
jgi:Ca-activated chloride channel family protein